MPLPGMRDRFPQVRGLLSSIPPASPGGRTLRSFRLCSRFPAVLIMFSEFCVAVIGSASMGSLFILSISMFPRFFAASTACDSSSGRQNCSGFPSFLLIVSGFLSCLFHFNIPYHVVFSNYIAAFDSNPFHGLCQAFHSNILNAKVFLRFPPFIFSFFLFSFESTPPAVSIGAANRVPKGEDKY